MAQKTTSGTTDLDLTKNELVRDVLEKCEAIEAGETPSAEDADKVGRAFDKMIKHWQGRGIRIWKKKEALLFQVASTQKYELGSSITTTNAVDDEDVVETTLTAAAVATATSLTVASITGIANADIIGILQDDNVIHWDTVNGVPSGSTVIITNGLAGAAASGSEVFAYATTERLVRPLRVLHCRRRNIASGIEVPIHVKSHSEYFDTPNKLITGSTNIVYYDPRRDVGLLYTWPTATNGSELLSFTYAKPIDNIGVTTDNPDFPDEWYDAITFNLASRISPDFGLAMDQRLWLKNEARERLDDMEMWDTEQEAVYIVPDMTYGGWTGA